MDTQLPVVFFFLLWGKPRYIRPKFQSLRTSVNKITCFVREQCVDPYQPLQDPVGHPVMHQSAIKHTTGEAVFVDDMPPISQELFLAVVTSTRAHAKIM